MAFLTLLLLLALQFAGRTHAAYTLDEVEAEIESYLGGDTTTGCALACDFLAFKLPDQLSYPGEDQYEFQQSRYWSIQQGETEPACRLAPTDAEEVSLAVLTSRVAECQFSVKSGGHAAFTGASNAPDGLTIDLINLIDIVVSDDQTQASIGAGNVWYDIYSYLQPLGLMVVGGRVGAIGIGGLTLGGGISFFSNRYGWACDNVNAYEVVFADGSIREVSPSSPYSDLYWALRGGGNNFGIVTRFDMVAYPQGDLWGGAQTYFYTDFTAAAFNDALYYFGVNSHSDPDGHVYIAYGYFQDLDSYVIVSALNYAKPEPYPEILRNFTSILLPIISTLRVDDLPSFTREFDNTTPGAFRQSFWTTTVGSDPDLTQQMVDIFMEEIEQIKDASDLTPSIIFQLVTTSTISNFAKNGGNTFGLEGQGPLNLVNIAISWSDESDDERIYAAAQNMVDRSAAAARTRGLESMFLYQNYAALQQDVFSSYGAANHARLVEISQKYDPDRVWQNLERGYFKL